MKRLIIKTLITVFIFFSVSCDDSFSPKGDFQEGYTLYCILDGNSQHQEAYLFKNFNPEGTDAASYNQDRTVPNAKIKILTSSSEFIFEDTSSFVESLGYSVNYYHLENFTPANFNNQQLTISAQTPEGKILSGQTLINTKKVNFGASTKKELQFNELDSLRVLFLNDELFQFTPFLIINYRLISNGDTSYFKKEVPINYVLSGTNEVAIYPDYKLRNRYAYSIANIMNEIKNIAQAKHPADKIKILNLTLGVLQVTNPLDVYYRTYKTFSDGFSIKTRVPNITNISNANGIFAFKNISTINILFRREWNNFFSIYALEQL